MSEELLLKLIRKVLAEILKSESNLAVPAMPGGIPALPAGSSQQDYPAYGSGIPALPAGGSQQAYPAYGSGIPALPAGLKKSFYYQREIFEFKKKFFN